MSPELCGYPHAYMRVDCIKVKEDIFHVCVLANVDDASMIFLSERAENVVICDAGLSKECVVRPNLIYDLFA